MTLSHITALNSCVSTCPPTVPLPEEEDFYYLPCLSTWQRRNHAKFATAGGCTFVGGVLASLGGWKWVVVGAAAGAIGNLASYLCMKTTQEQLDLEETVRYLKQQDEINQNKIAELSAKIDQLAAAKMQ